VIAHNEDQQPGTRSVAPFERLAALIRGGSDSVRRGAPADPEAYEAVFQRLSESLGGHRQRLARERQLGPRQWEALEKHPQARRLVRIRNDRRFQTWGFHQFLIQRSCTLAAADPRAAADAAELALAVARCLDPADYGEERVSDFRAEALAALAEAKRQQNDLAGAWVAFEAARDCLWEGTGDPLEKAELELLHERLLRDAGRQEDAELALQRARNLFRRIGDPRLESGNAPAGETRHRARQGRR
jgi:hypothetical protein